MQVGDDEEGAEERDALDHFRRLDADCAQQRFEQVREGWLTHPAQAQRGKGDTQLAGGQVGVQLAVDGTQDLPAPAMLFGNRLDPGRAQFDHGELGGNEKAVEQHQQQSKKNHAEIGEK
ncbi:hypothetical protein D9M73_164510 [compost metagenome]